MDFGSQGMYHIGLKPEQGAAYALLTGDPGRVEAVASRLEEPVFVCANREYTTWAGRLQGERVLTISHGIGGPSTAICVEELCRCGVKTMIRVGTCGGMRLDVLGGDLVVATAAIRQEGTSREYLPVEFPAAADFAVTGALMEAAAGLGKKVHAGVVHCKDSFYGQHSPETSPVPGCGSNGMPGNGAAAWLLRWNQPPSSFWPLPGGCGRAACWKFFGTRNGRRRDWRIPGPPVQGTPSTRQPRPWPC